MKKIFFPFFVFSFIISLSFAHDIDLDNKTPEHRAVVVHNDQELLKSLEPVRWPCTTAPLHSLHITYTLSSFLLTALFPDSAERIAEPLQDLTTLNLNRGKNRYGSERPEVIFSLEWIANYKNLTSLNLSYIKLSENIYRNPIDLSPLLSLRNLKHLYLKGVNLKWIEQFNKFHNLISLDISHNDFQDINNIPAVPLKNLSTLTSLNVEDSCAENFCGSYSALVNLTELNVAHNYNLRIQNLTPLTQLKKLDMRLTKNLSPKDILHLTNLQSLEELKVSSGSKHVNGLYAKDLIELLKMTHLKIIYITDRCYREFLNDYYHSEEIKNLIQKDNIKIVPFDESQEWENEPEMNLEGLTTQEDFLEYNDRMNLRY